MQKNIEKFSLHSNPMTQLVIDDIKSEINLFREYSDFYGYTFYIRETS
ncbi:hypothetical protein [Geminocystis sp. GBBB08]|nr:hypothetical protein [Geminocystis sp. GBBB08]